MEIIKIEMEDEKYPTRLLKTKNFPTKIYVMGDIELLNAKYTVGIVGSRNCTEYGIKVASEFALELSKQGICIISGMAVGIDGIAHNGAINQVGKTIAVLGSGFNYIYPEENEWLFHKILDNGGCIVSEYPPDTEPDCKNFPIRNRIISGLSDAVVVVEAIHRSGSTITAKYAKKEGKPVFAVPNNIYAKTGAGTNRLIQEGAILVTSTNKIIEKVKPDTINKSFVNKQKEVTKNGAESNRLSKYKEIEREEQYKNSEEEEAEEKKSSKQIMSKEYLEIYRVLSDEPTHINELAKKLRKSIQEIMPVITMMEIDEYAHQTQTNYFMRNM